MPAILSKPLAKYVLTAALRDRLMITSLLVVLVSAAIALFLGSSAIIESDRFALVFAASGLRIAAMAGLVLFVVFYMRRAFEAREVEFLLSRPISRVSFLCSHALAFSALATAAAFLVTLSIAVVSLHHGNPGLPLWAVSVWIEFIIMANATLFFSMVLSSATGSAMAVFGLYVLARLMGEILAIMQREIYMPGHAILSLIMKTVSLIVPRLDLMGQSSWLIYGTGDSTVGFGFVLIQGLIYSGLLVTAALVDLARRQF
jgi:hypothetical protein